MKHLASVQKHEFEKQLEKTISLCNFRFNMRLKVQFYSYVDVSPDEVQKE